MKNITPFFLFPEHLSGVEIEIQDNLKLAVKDFILDLHDLTAAPFPEQGVIDLLGRLEK